MTLSIPSNKLSDLITALQSLDPDTHHSIESVETKMLGPQGGIRTLILNGIPGTDELKKLRREVDEQDDEIHELENKLDDIREELAALENKLQHIRTILDDV